GAAYLAPFGRGPLIEETRAKLGGRNPGPSNRKKNKGDSTRAPPVKRNPFSRRPRLACMARTLAPNPHDIQDIISQRFATQIDLALARNFTKGLELLAEITTSIGLVEPCTNTLGSGGGIDAPSPATPAGRSC